MWHGTFTSKSNIDSTKQREKIWLFEQFGGEGAMHGHEMAFTLVATWISQPFESQPCKYPHTVLRNDNTIFT
jgi:hypothetical protein